MWDTPTVFLFHIAAISPQSSFLIWKDKVHGIHFFDTDRFVLTCSEYIKMWMTEGHPTSNWFNKTKRSLWIFIYVWAGVFVCAHMCVCERDAINITLTIVKYVTEVICSYKSMNTAHVKAAWNSSLCIYQRIWQYFEWKKIKLALHKICFSLSFFPCN